MERSNNTNRRRVLKAIGAGIVGGTALTGTSAARGGLKQELAEVRSATAAYNDVQNARDDGYDGPVSNVCGMGYHFGNLSLFGTSLNPTEPAVLAYGEDDDGNLVLGAVEWIVSKQVSPTEPDIFDHDDGAEVWQEDSPFEGVWSMHAWVHNHNPEGVFHPTNPRELFFPDGCVGGHH